MHAVMEQAPAGSRTFYSTSGGLHLTVRTKTNHVDATTGQVKGLPGKYIKFNPMGGTSHGRYVTNDPEEIEYLEKRIASGARDVFNEEGYVKLITPADIRANNAALALAEERARNEELQRTIENQNRLLAQLTADQKNQSANNRPRN